MPGATIGPEGNFFNLKAEEFQTVLNLNLTGTVIPTQVFLKPMVKQGKGSVINFSSMAAFRPLTRVCGYAAAKAGISNFTAFMATECAKKFGEGIRVNAIAPGFFLTEQNRSLLTNPDGTYTKRGQDVVRQTPFGRMGDPEELCGTIHYLMSDAGVELLPANGYHYMWHVKKYPYNDGRRELIGNVRVPVDDLSWTSVYKSEIIRQWRGAL